MITEIWKTIPGFDYCEVSNLGNVRTWFRVGNWKDKIAEAPHQLIPSPAGKPPGYLKVSLRGIDGKRRQKYVHALVLEAFIGQCPDGLEACHADGNKLNNELGNLRWDTHPSNELDKKRHQTSGIGERNAMAKLTDDDVRTIRDMSMNGIPHRRISEQFGVNPGTVWKISYGERWSHITGPIHSKDSPYQNNEPAENYFAKHKNLFVGERHGSARLTDQQVLSIREKAANGQQRCALAKEYNVSISSIDHIVTRKSWKHLK